jgi:DNA-binding transcriptional LysR family regulator
VGAVGRVVVASPDYVRRRGRPKSPGDLAAHQIIAFAGIDGVERWRFQSAGRTVDALVKPRLIVTTAESAIDAAVSGFGITRVLSYQAVEALQDRTLLRLLRHHEGAEAPIHLLYPDGRHPPPKLRAFLDFLSPRLRQRCDAITRAIAR